MIWARFKINYRHLEAVFVGSTWISLTLFFLLVSTTLGLTKAAEKKISKAKGWFLAFMVLLKYISAFGIGGYVLLAYSERLVSVFAGAGISFALFVLANYLVRDSLNK
jgi:hypothetical protein